MKRWKLLTLLLLVALLGLSALGAWPAWQRYQVEQCLPQGVVLSSITVSGPLLCTRPKHWLLHRIGLSDDTVLDYGRVADELERLGAMPRAGKLLAADGNEIVFLVEDGRVDYEDWKFGEKHVIVVPPGNSPPE
jgi:hypothetical protein